MTLQVGNTELRVAGKGVFVKYLPGMKPGMGILQTPDGNWFSETPLHVKIGKVAV